MSKDYEDRILREQVGLAMQQLPTGLVTKLIAALVLAWSVYGIVAPQKILLWIAMLLATVLGRTLFYLRFRKAREGAFDGKYWKNLYLTLAMIAGAVWGTSAFIIFPPVDYPGLILLFLLVAAGISVFSTVSHSSLRLGPAAWAGPAILIYVARCCMERAELGYTIGILGLLLLLTIILYGLKHNRFITSNIILRLENEQLLEEVRKVNDTISREIAERNLARKTLEESEEKFRLAFRTSPDSINLNRLSDGTYVDINEGFTKITGFTRDDVIGKTSLDLNVWRNPKDREGLGAGLAANGFMENMEAEFNAKDGRILTGLMSARILRINQEDMILSITRDITAWRKTEEEKKKLEAELFFAQKMESVGRLAGGVAHDFNNMLGVIIGRAEMSLHLGVSNDGLRQNLNEIINAAQRSADLTRQLLAFASKQPATPKITDLNETISGIFVMLQRLIGEDIDLSWMPGNDLRRVRIDPSQIDQVLVNLVANARDSISGAGNIAVRTDNFVVDGAARADRTELAPGNYVRLVVEDSGAGMSREVCEKIFEPFFTTKELGKGTGLGLSTVYGIVKQNSGFIDVVSEPGKGTAFEIYLPGVEHGNESPSEKKASGYRPTGAETILLVEDDRAILDLCENMLETLGYTVLASHDPARAISLAETHPGNIDLLITDVIMPEMNGRELVEKLEKIRPGLKSLYMSGYTADVIGDRGILENSVNLIQKPFGSEDFALKVRQVLDGLRDDSVPGK